MEKTNNRQDNALDAMLTHRNSEMEQEIKINAQSFGQQNLSSPIGDNMVLYYEEHHFQSQQLIDKVNTGRAKENLNCCPIVVQ